MCGIFGLVANKESENINDNLILNTINDLFLLSEARGKEAAGLAAISHNKINVFKESTPASKLIKKNYFKSFLKNSINENENNYAYFGHCRLVTNGDESFNHNNQPVLTDNITGIHNGIIVNEDKLWKKHKTFNRKYEVDTEIILKLVDHYLTKNKVFSNAISKTINNIEGAASIAVSSKYDNSIALATNNGSLYYCTDNKNIFIFSSEEYILKQLVKSDYLKQLLNNDNIKLLKDNTGLIVNINNLSNNLFEIKNEKKIKSDKKIDLVLNKNILDLSHNKTKKNIFINKLSNLNKLEKVYNKLDPLKTKLKRCTKCILPETFPFIEFDKYGVCNFCRSHEKNKIHGEGKLKKIINQSKQKNKYGNDSLISISGGRDSCYGLHYAKSDLKLNPIAYTYDWGMVTDLARRNISRICGKLGIEHVVVSADIKKKRDNIRKNILAWLKKPNLGMIPLFTAGDKQFYYYANQLSKQTNIDLMIFCAGNHYEKTNFKTGFCGIDEGKTEGTLTLSTYNKVKLLKYYGMQYLTNPSYLNSSMFDTLWAYLASYSIAHDYIFMFNYLPWDEKEIMDLLITEYDWEIADDTIATWRIGDGTAPFYNYIYYTVAGFTENDTFRSNQIRENALDRKTALKIVEKENLPRWAALKWYFDAIELDMFDVINKVNKIPRLY